MSPLQMSNVKPGQSVGTSPARISCVIRKRRSWNVDQEREFACGDEIE